MPIALFVLLAVLVIKVIDVARFAAARDVVGVVVQVMVWVVGVVLMFLTAATDIADGIGVGGKPLSAVEGGTLFLLGMAMASLGSVIHDFSGRPRPPWFPPRGTP